MTETKTFKNAMIQTDYVGDYHDMNHIWKITASAGQGNPYGTFGHEDWDMEVTFTKKRGPVESGQWREMSVIGKEVAVYVLAIYGSVAWVTDDPEDLEQGRTNAWTEPIASLR